MNLQKKIIAAAGFAVLALVCTTMLMIYDISQKAPVEGQKTVYIEAVSQRDDYSYSEKFTTSFEYLGDLLAEEGIIGYETGDYGRFITSVQGIEAKNEDQSWWCVYVNGETAVNGVDEIVLEDGSTYKLELTIGW